MLPQDDIANCPAQARQVIGRTATRGSPDEQTGSYHLIEVRHKPDLAPAMGQRRRLKANADDRPLQDFGKGRDNLPSGTGLFRSPDNHAGASGAGHRLPHGVGFDRPCGDRHDSECDRDKRFDTYHSDSRDSDPFRGTLSRALRRHDDRSEDEILSGHQWQSGYELPNGDQHDARPKAKRWRREDPQRYEECGHSKCTKQMDGGDKSRLMARQLQETVPQQDHRHAERRYAEDRRSKLTRSQSKARRAAVRDQREKQAYRNRVADKRREDRDILDPMQRVRNFAASRPCEKICFPGVAEQQFIADEPADYGRQHTRLPPPDRTEDRKIGDGMDRNISAYRQPE